MSGGHDKNTTYLVFTHDNAFNGNETVEDLNGNVYILNDIFPYNATLNPFYTYSNNIKNLNDIDFYWDEGYLPPPSFNNNFTKVILGENVTIIGENAFQGCEYLSYVTIPNSVTSIRDNAFSDCNLNSVIIPDSVTSIGEIAFYGIYPLKTINVGNSVTSIGEDAFSGCFNLQTVYIADNQLGIPSPATNVSFFGAIVNTKLPTITVSGEYKITSVGVDRKSGLNVAASSTFTASASGINTYDANNSLIKHVCEQFILTKVNDFSSKYRNDSYNLTFTHK